MRFPITCAELRRLYEEERLGIVAIARHYGCSPTTVSHRLRDCAVPTRPSRFQARVVSLDELHRLYVIERLPIADIARQLGVSMSTISNRRRASGIPIRPRTITPGQPAAVADQRLTDDREA